MSNSLLQSDPDALRDSAIAVITYVRDAMNEGVALLRDHDRLLVENQSDHRLDAEIKTINENLRLVNENLKRVRLGELTMTIVAPTSAGKSTVINAIAGQDLLPRRNDPMTVLPTEIVFSREVAKPELFLSEDLMTLLPKVWRLLHQELEEIGLEKAVEQATKKHFPRENVIQEILKGSSVAFQSEVKESNRIQGELIRINDLLRLCGIFGIVTDLSQMPRIEVPFPPELSSLAGLGTLVLVDTPGVSEGKFLNLVNVVQERLEASSLVLVVVDYKNIKQTETVKKLVDEIAEVKGRDRIYIIVNKIDARDSNNPEDLTTKQIFDLVKTKYEIDDPQNRVFEMSAIKGFLATNFQREKEIYQSTELRNSKSFEALGQKYYNDSWEDRKKDISLSEMDKAANKYWQRSGFADFMEKAIAPLVTDTAPSIITIEGALNDITQKFAGFLSCLSKQKRILERAIQQLEIDINQLEMEITAINSHITNINEIKSIKYKAQQELGIILDTESHELLEEINHHANILLQKAIDLYPLESKKVWQMIFMSNNYFNGQMLDEISVFRDKYCTGIKYYYNRLISNLSDRIKQIIEQINNDYSTQHELVLSNSQKRLHKIVRCDIKSDTYLDFIIPYERANDEIMYKSKDFVRHTSNGTSSMGESFSYGKPSNTEDFITLSIKEYRWGCYDKFLFVPGDLRAWRGRIPYHFKEIGQNIIGHMEKQLNEDIDAFIQQRDNLLKEYEQDLQSSLKAVQHKLNRCLMIKNKYVQFLGKTANLEKDLKYQQDYCKQH